MGLGRRDLVAVAGALGLALGWLGVGLLVAAWASLPASADVLRERDGWTIEKVFAASGEFRGCGATVLSSDWRIGLAHSSDGAWEMLFSRPGRPFEAGARYGVSLVADRRVIYRGVAEVLPGGLAFLSPELSESAVLSLGRAGLIEFATRLGRKGLRLRGAAGAIDALRGCVDRHGRADGGARTPRARP